MGRAREGRLTPPSDDPPVPVDIGEQLPDGDADFIEKAYRRGKVSTDDLGVLERLRHQFLQGLRTTFVTQPELKGASVVTTDGKTRTRYFSSAIDRLRTLHSAQRNARSEAQKTVSALFRNLTPDEYGAVNRYLFVRDALENVARGIERRPGFDESTLTQKLAELQAEVDVKPDAQRAIESYQQLMQSVRDHLVAEGFMPEVEAPREWYYPHTVIDFTQTLGRKIFGITVPRLSSAGIRWKTPRNAMKRAGSSRDISTQLADQMENYLADVFTQIEKRRVLRQIGEQFDVRNNQTFTDAQGNPVTYAEHGNQIPPGYVRWDANRGYSRLRASSVAERYLGEMIDYGGLDELARVYKVDPVEFRAALEQVGIDNPEALVKSLGATMLPPENIYVIPEELARTMDHTIDTMNTAESRGLSEILVRGFKTAVLNFMPIRYNFRNMVGDLQRMYTQYGPEILDADLWKSVAKSVHGYYKEGTIDALTQQMLDGGVSSSGRIQSEYMLSQIDPHLKLLEHGIESNNLKVAADQIWRLLKVIPEASSAREDIVRGVLVEMNNRRLARGDQLLYGVADKELVQGLLDNGEPQRAVNYIARKSLLDYGDFTPRENKWRNGIFPFYAWAAGNFQFWASLAREVGTGGARKMLGRGTTGLLVGGSTKALVSGTVNSAIILASIRAWNDMIMGDDEERLPQTVQSRLHFVVPDYEHWSTTGELRALKDDEGKTVVWATSDALDDFLTYLGIDTAVPEAMSVLRGTLSKDEWLERQKEHFGWGLAGPARTALGQLGPLPNALTQVVAHKRLFPDPLNPQDIPPEQQGSTLRDVAGLASVPGIEGAVGALTPGGDVFQPAMKAWDIPSQLGLRSFRTPSIYQEHGMTMYEADLVRQIQAKMGQLHDLQGRMVREKSMRANRQLDPETRQKNFDTRLDILENSLVEELKQLTHRYQTLRRSRAR